MSINSNDSIKKKCSLFIKLFFLIVGYSTTAQIYYHDFGTTAITAHPYTVAPTTLNTHLSNSSWSNSVNAWTSTTGATGEAIRLTSATASTVTLTFNVAANYQVAVTSFNFWRLRSNFGPQNWTMTINGINVGTGTIGTTGAALGNTNVSNAISGLTGTVTVVISLTGATGNGTFRLDDFTLNGSVTSNCVAPTITSFTPASGPQNTLVTINGNGFSLGTGTSSVKFNGIAASSFTVISNTEIKAYVPAGNVTGNISVTTNGCEGFSSGVFTQLPASNNIGNYSSDVYISEVYDAQAGSGGVIELYNGTASPIDLTGYIIRRYGDIGVTNSFYDITLYGIIPPGGIFLVGVGSTPVPCNGLVFNITGGSGFNGNDEFELIKNGVVIDNVHAPNNVGYSIVRNSNAIAPKPVFNSSDWGTSTTESCSDIGSHDITVNNPPTVTNPISKITCENNPTIFSATLTNSTGYTYQWKTLNASGTWVNVTNGSPYSGATTSTLTINPTPVGFDNNQYYCQITSTLYTLNSNAAQLEVNPSTIPDFTTALAFCSGATVPALATTSPNGITGTWSPSTISNTTSGNYVFTPNTGQCATPVTLNVTISNSITPNFATSLSFCNGGVVPTLNTTSPNGITGTWSPSAISNTASGSYVFTPDAGQCATSITLNVTITNNTIPDFATTLAYCAGETVATLNTTSPNGITGTWNPSVISNTASGSYVFTPDAGQCATNITLNVTITNNTVPDFATSLAFCNGSTVPTLSTTSPNGVTGTWSPSAISNTASGSYVFTPDAGQCATSITLNVTITNNTVPDFATSLSFCNGATVPALSTTSPNGITGTWSPSVINNTASGSYVFTPNPGQCATSTTLNVTITNTIVTDFATSLTFCSGGTVPALNATSPNGITGTWSPSAISNTASGSYIFTPDAGQCATNVTLNVTITNSTIPNFATSLSFCNGSTVPALSTTSPNGITGTWNPSAISNTASGNYVFTPDAGQCATTATLNVTITNNTTPDFATSLSFCNGASVPVLSTTSPNGITGTWSPSAISNTASGSYIFTPDAGQCATSVTLNVTITNNTVPDFATNLTYCTNGTVATLNTTSPNGITGTWSPSAISNTASGSYLFTPDAGQCATSVTLNVTITNSIIPNFATSLSFCSGSTVPALNTTSPNGITGTWSPSVINNTASGSYVFTPNPGQCATSTTLNVTITNTIVTDFATSLTFCSGGTVPALNATSPNGITGTWSPSAISNTASGSYIFTPNAGQCATTVTLNVVITNSITPNFATSLSFCNGDTVPALSMTSPNGITGTWNPSAISNTASGSYVFTPDAGQCATTATLNVTITNTIAPDFATSLSFCNGDTVPALSTPSPNGITGTWSPSAISNTTSDSYVFTPNSGQCASSVTLNVIINNAVSTPIDGPNAVCMTETMQLTNTTADGTWSSNNTTIATIDATGNVTGISTGNAIITYTVDNGTCVSTASKTIRVNALPNPIIEDDYLCVNTQTGAVLSAVNLNCGLSNMNYSFVWTLNNTVLSTTTNTHQAILPGVYEVTATNLLTGCAASSTATIGTSSIAVAEAIVGRDFDKNQTITINVTGGSGDYEFQLDGGMPQTSNQFTNIREGEYEITVRDTRGCGAITLTVYALNYPYYFTPNEDGYNDTWNIDGLANQPKAEVFIFDRYGKLIKQLKPSSPIGWDGTFNGRALPATDYWFKLIYQSRDGAQKEFKAHFALKR